MDNVEHDFLQELIDHERWCYTLNPQEHSLQLIIERSARVLDMVATMCNTMDSILMVGYMVTTIHVCTYIDKVLHVYMYFLPSQASKMGVSNPSQNKMSSTCTLLSRQK